MKDIVKMIKRINERSRDVARTFGTDSSYYQSYMNLFNKIESYIQGSTSQVRGKQHFRISTSKKVVEKIDKKIVDLLKESEKHIRTKGQIIQDVKKRFDIKKSTVAIEKAIVLSDDMNFIKENIDKLYEISEFRNEIRRKNKKNIDSDKWNKMQEYINNPNYRQQLIKKELGIDDNWK